MIHGKSDNMSKEANFGLFIYDLLKDAGINPIAEESGVVEVEKALKTSSKKQTGRGGEEGGRTFVPS